GPSNNLEKLAIVEIKKYTTTFINNKSENFNPNKTSLLKESVSHELMYNDKKIIDNIHLKFQPIKNNLSIAFITKDKEKKKDLIKYFYPNSFKINDGYQFDNIVNYAKFNNFILLKAQHEGTQSFITIDQDFNRKTGRKHDMNSKLSDFSIIDGEKYYIEIKDKLSHLVHFESGDYITIQHEHITLLNKLDKLAYITKDRKKLSADFIYGNYKNIDLFQNIFHVNKIGSDVFYKGILKENNKQTIMKIGDGAPIYKDEFVSAPYNLNNKLFFVSKDKKNKLRIYYDNDISEPFNNFRKQKLSSEFAYFHDDNSHYKIFPYKFDEFVINEKPLIPITKWWGFPNKFIYGNKIISGKEGKKIIKDNDDKINENAIKMATYVL
ncbi:hypothetical protein HN415_00140, partial [Candidatus Woesearchaeota archaeon]|nr:hypothetical protein [Candidatus Woesearchaeota archaeon]